MSRPHFAIALALLLAAAAVPAQQRWREYPSIERGWYRPQPPPEQTPGEFVVGRLMFPQVRRGYMLGAGPGDWRAGGTAWTVDYPEGDRTFARLLNRLTTIDVRLVEQPVNLDDDIDAFYWPFMISGLVGAWDLTDAQAAKLREYLLRGGFLLCDSFYGTVEWEGFLQGIRKVFPDRPIVDLPDDHPVFHIVYDLKEITTAQIPNMNSLMAGGGGYLSDGVVPRWRGVLDDDGRLMVLIAFNNDVADSWQWADDPDYPAVSAQLGLRLGVNMAVYAMTH